MNKDNLYTAAAKGMALGALKSTTVWLGIAGIVYTFGKMVDKVETENKEEEEIEENKEAKTFADLNSRGL